MKAQELRIGNWYMFADNEGICYRTVKEIKYNQFGFISDYDGTNFEICKPIPLTEKWLLKFGFEWSIRHQAWHKLSFIFDLSERGVGGYYMHIVKKNDEIICPEIIYVHELQNLYFALTGEELTINQ